MRASDVFLFLGLGLHLVRVRAVLGGWLEVDALLKYLVKIVHSGCSWCNIKSQAAHPCLRSPGRPPVFLMMEQAHASKGHGYAIFITSLDDIVIANAATRLRYVLHAALVGSLNVVAKWEERV